MNNPSPYLNPHIVSAAELKTSRTSLPPRLLPPTYTAGPADDQEDDDSTIKCICGFKHDDGSSVFCEKCNTWQHTECYYYIEEEDRVPTRDELEAILHLCTDCEPRSLDIQAAVTRQKLRIPELDHDGRKVKKTASKSHKKKTKTPEANGVLTNGLSHEFDGPLDRTNRSPRDHLNQPKRPKTNHRSINSLSIPPLNQNPTSLPHRRSASSLDSPSKASGKHSSYEFLKGPYSAEFIHLYDNDPGDQPLQTNLLSDINITGDLSLWAYDAEALKEATRGFSHADVFHRMDRPLFSMMGPPPRKEYMEDESVVLDGQHPRWICLKRDVFTEEKTIVGELKGKVGHMKDYIQEPANRWDYLRHPAPFVFFHPRLPIYIDTRSEGTICRYLRRSCRPNLIMTTFLENDSEYHFCFTAKQDIPSGAELTIGWVLDEHMRKFNSIKNDMTLDIGAGGEEYITDWVGKVFPEFGGCACGAPDDCWLSSRIKASAKGRSSLTRPRQSITSHAISAKEDSDRDDERSTSGSKSESRDMTPTALNVSDYGLGPGMEISDREKRKIAALEKNFEQLENDKHQPVTKKKKRNSGGSNVNTPAGGVPVRIQIDQLTRARTDRVEQRQLGHTATSFSQPNTPCLPSKTQYADASTSRRKSGSPTGKGSNIVGRPRSSNLMNLKKSSRTSTPPNPSLPARPNYVSVAIQTEPDDEGDWYVPKAQTLRPRKPYMSLTKRLLLRSQHDRQRLEDWRHATEASPRQEAVSSQGVAKSYDLKSSRLHQDVDVADAGTVSSLVSQYSAGDVQTLNPDPNIPIPRRSIECEPPPCLSQATQQSSEQSRPVNGFRSIARVQPPPKPSQSFDSSFSAPLTQTPTSAVPSPPYTQTSSPLPSSIPTSTAGLVQPSPVKKKVSLSDYIKRKGSQSTESKPTTGSPEMSHSTLRTPLVASIGDGPMDGSAIIDTPKKEEFNPLDPTAEGVSAVAMIKEEQQRL